MKKKNGVYRWLQAYLVVTFLMMSSIALAADKVVVIPLFSQNSSADSTTYTNTIGMIFSKIPAGSFIMGSPDGRNGLNDTTPPHRPFWPQEYGDHIADNEMEIQHIVAITKSFYMQTTEVTQAQYLQVMQTNGYTNPSQFQGCGSDCPVEMVSWEDTQLFISTLNARENRTNCNSPGNTCYSLPTEAQWEYAARAGTVTAFYSGDIADGTHGSCDQLDNNLDSIGWYCVNSGNTTHPVAQKEPNNWGLYDMSGNVEEWCEDRSNSGQAPEEDMQYPEVAYNDTPVEDPTGRTTGSHRVSRGGGWDHDARSARSAKRLHHNPVSRFDTVGFRISLPAAQ